MAWILAGVVAGAGTALVIIGLWAMDGRCRAARRRAVAAVPSVPPGEHVLRAEALHRATGMNLEWCKAEAAAAERGLPAAREATSRRT